MSLFHKNDVYISIVDSSQRVSGTSSNFTINLNLPVYVGDFDRVSLNQFSCPRSWYDVATNFNTFTLKESGVTMVITVPIGMYNALTLASTLSTLMTTASATFGLAYTYTVTYPNSSLTVNTNKFLFTSTGHAFNTNLIFTNSMYQQLGFAANSNNLFNIGGSSSTLTSVNSISISYINRIFLTSNACNTSYNSYLQEILIAGQFPSTSFVYFEAQNFDINSKEFTNPLNNAWDFTLYDRYGNVIDLNGLEVVFSLIFYKKNKTDEIHMEHIKLQNLENLL